MVQSLEMVDSEFLFFLLMILAVQQRLKDTKIAPSLCSAILRDVSNKMSVFSYPYRAYILFFKIHFKLYFDY